MTDKRGRRGRCWAAALPPLLAAVAGGPAAAQEERPPMLPTRDVAIVYRVVGGPPGLGEMRTSWLASEGRQRIELPGAPRVVVVDHRNPGASFMVIDSQRAVLPLPAGAEAMLGTPGGAKATGRFTRAGSASYAGQNCTVWRHEDERQTGEACVTEDGVMLRGVGTREGRTGGLEAVEVAYGPQDPARFRWPDGYQVVRPPSAR